MSSDPLRQVENNRDGRANASINIYYFDGPSFIRRAASNDISKRLALRRHRSRASKRIMPPHRALNAPSKTHNSERLERMAEKKICHESILAPYFLERRKPETLRRRYIVGFPAVDGFIAKRAF